jgi:hypothetical protein
MYISISWKLFQQSVQTIEHARAIETELDSFRPSCSEWVSKHCQLADPRLEEFPVCIWKICNEPVASEEVTKQDERDLLQLLQ